MNENRNEIPEDSLIPMIYDEESMTKEEYEKEKKRIILHFRNEKGGSFSHEVHGKIYIYNFASSNMNRNQKVVQELLKIKEINNCIHTIGGPDIYHHFENFQDELRKEFKFDRALHILMYQYRLITNMKGEYTFPFYMKLFFYENIIEVLGSLNRLEDIIALSKEMFNGIREFQPLNLHIPFLYQCVACVFYMLGMKNYALDLLDDGINQLNRLKSEDVKMIVGPLLPSEIKSKKFLRVLKFNNIKRIHELKDLKISIEKPDFDPIHLLKNPFKFNQFFELCKNDPIEIQNLSSITQAFLFEKFAKYYLEQHDYEKSLEYAKKSVNIFIKTGTYIKRTTLLIGIILKSSLMLNDEKTHEYYGNIFEKYQKTPETLPISIIICKCQKLFPQFSCKGCGIKRYCSRECQKKDWENHKIYCNMN
jgi:hypothetical protein